MRRYVDRFWAMIARLSYIIRVPSQTPHADGDRTALERCGMPLLYGCVSRGWMIQI